MGEGNKLAFLNTDCGQLRELLVLDPNEGEKHIPRGFDQRSHWDYVNNPLKMKLHLKALHNYWWDYML